MMSYCPKLTGEELKVKVKVGFFYSATYTVNHRDQPHFIISEVVVDWQEPMVLQRKLRPFIARVNGLLDPRYLNKIVISRV